MAPRLRSAQKTQGRRTSIALTVRFDALRPLTHSRSPMGQLASNQGDRSCPPSRPRPPVAACLPPRRRHSVSPSLPHSACLLQRPATPQFVRSRFTFPKLHLSI